ncbi:hypothetical protein [Sandarakinorhabdus sp. DWP1-3-1]|uniref:hypothetical protein n=1 Tax=Sandarakinorhabdus sp. DWP1-3-1 TaxID=2804627 RepID=UPI003CF5EC54
MATIVAGARGRPRQDRLFFGGAALALVLVTFVGFAPTYYLASAFHAPALSPLVHLHGIAFSAWILLFAAQSALIASRRTDLHRRAGMFGAALALFVLGLGIVVAIEGARHGGGGPQRNQPVFLINPLTNILLFGGLFATAILWRRDAGLHKRLMLLATVALAVTPLARLSRMLGSPYPPPIGGMLLSDLFVIALMMFDYRTRGRLHPATAWAGGIMLVSQPLRVFVSHTPAWQGLATMIIG